MTEERETPLLLIWTVQIVAGMLEDAGKTADADLFRLDLESDLRAVAVRYAGPEFRELRQTWVLELDR